MANSDYHGMTLPQAARETLLRQHHFMGVEQVDMIRWQDNVISDE
jgi:hypothetical protein